MLIERTFALGGWVCIVSGVALALAIVLLAPGAWVALSSSAFLIGFGALFVFVGRDARRSRLELLASPRTVDESEVRSQR